MRCCECEKELPHGAPWQEVVGFERKRDQGGTNALALRKPTGRMMCDACMRARKLGLSAQQQTLGEVG